MPWCPKCKLEYVAGINVCPDCKSALVEDLSAIEEEEFNAADSEAAESARQKASKEEFESNPKIIEITNRLKAQGLDDDEIQAVFHSLRNEEMHIRKDYKPYSDKYEENKSGASVLFFVGIAGLIVLLVNFLGVKILPITGFSLILTYIVMGSLFLVFTISGVTSRKKAKELEPLVEQEKEQIKEVLEFVKSKQAEGYFELAIDDISMEEASLYISARAVKACEEEFENLPEGLAFYVVDRNYEEIFSSSEETEE